MNLIIVLRSVLLLALCGGIAPAEEFRFPGGNAEQGKVAFEQLNCIQCHRIKDVTLEQPKTKRVLNLSLGEEIRFVKRYTDILIAITNPQHVVTKQYSGMLSETELAGAIEAFMPNLKEDMSAAQLIDLATFLDQVYRKNLSDYPAAGN